MENKNLSTSERQCQPYYFSMFIVDEIRLCFTTKTKNEKAFIFLITNLGELFLIISAGQKRQDNPIQLKPHKLKSFFFLLALLPPPIIKTRPASYSTCKYVLLISISRAYAKKKSLIFKQIWIKFFFCCGQSPPPPPPSSYSSWPRLNEQGGVATKFYPRHADLLKKNSRLNTKH